MALFNWISGDGNWITPENWNLLLGSGVAPPGSGDIAFFADAVSAYTVNITTTVTVGQIEIIPTTSTASFAISGSLTTGALTFDTPQAISMTVDVGGLLNVTNALDSLAAPETITIAGTEAGGEVELGNLFGVGSNLVFAFDNTSPTSPNTGIIQFDNVLPSPDSVLHAPVTNVAWGNEFVVTGVNFTGDTVNYDGTALTVVDRRGDTLFAMTNVSAAAGTTFVIAGSDTIEAVCYARGTMIRTPAGDLPIETLRSGMQVITLVDGAEIPQTVAWLGHRRIDLTTHLRPETVAPIRIERDAIADGMPHRDLLVSPDHAIFVDGMLICARQLVNGITIRQERDSRAVHYYHVELDEHAILLAEGLPAESYIDTGNSGFFTNSEAPLVLHPDLTGETDYPTREAGSCAPFVTDEANVQPVWQRLFDRAAVIGRPVTQRATTTDADLRLLADRHTVKPVFSDSNRVIFILPPDAPEVRLLSRAQAPTEARPWLGDQRRLGVRVKRIALRGADGLREVPVDHPDITRGWWGVERDGQMISRWTDGEAVLPLPATRGHVVLEIHLAGSMIYAVDAAPEDGTERRAA